MVKFTKQDLSTSNDPAILKSELFNSLDKRQQRLIKNRLSADASRKRKKEQFDGMNRAIEELQTENLELKVRIEELLQENSRLHVQNQALILSAQLPINCNNYQTNITGEINTCFEEQVLLPTPSPVLSMNGSTLSIPNDSDEELANRMFSDFIDFGDPQTHATETHDYLNIGLKSVFSMFLFSFAAFLLPFQFQQHTSLPSVIPSLDSTFSSADGLPFANALVDRLSSDLVKNEWHLDHYSNLHAGSSVATLPLEPDSFLKSLSDLSKINPPNAVIGIEGLFDSISANPLDVKLAIVPPSLSSLSNRYSKEFVFDHLSCINQASLMIDPSIRIAPYVSFGSEDEKQKLRLSLFAHIPASSGLGRRGEGGILKLDLQVFHATFLKE